MESVLPINSIALTISVVTSFGILLAKGRFIYRILKARTDVNVFNHSIALCFAVVWSENNFVADGIVCVFVCPCLCPCLCVLKERV